MPKTLYRVEGTPSGAPSPGPDPSDRARGAGRGTLFWVLLALLLVTLVMIAVIATLGATESGASGTLSTSTTDPADVSTTLPTGPPATTAAVASTTDSTAASTTSSSAGTTSTTYLTHAIADPARLVIPSLKVDATMAKVGLLDNGAMEIPAVGVVGWFGPGPVPGASGPSVVVSHVSYGGKKGAFYRLKDMKPGDQVLIYDKTGDVATFQVDSLETILKTALPTERIWNNTKEAVLRLVTCGGEYDPATKHYLSNVIVYAHLVK